MNLTLCRNQDENSGQKQGKPLLSNPPSSMPTLSKREQATHACARCAQGVILDNSESGMLKVVLWWPKEFNLHVGTCIRKLKAILEVQYMLNNILL